MVMIKLIVVVTIFAFCYSDNLKGKNPVAEAANLHNVECGGWGKKIENMKDYDAVKTHCYLTFRFNVLCCIEKPDCPGDLIPETPIIPYFLYPIEKVELGCVEGRQYGQKWTDCDGETEPTASSLENGHVKKKTLLKFCV